MALLNILRIFYLSTGSNYIVLMRGIEQQPIIAYAIILVIAVLVFMDRELLKILPRNTLFVGFAVLAMILYFAIRNKTSTYI